jgi:hypothetical protein
MAAMRMLLTSLLLAMVLACGDRGTADEASPAAATTVEDILKGYAVFGHEVRTIKPCGAAEPLWVIDSTQLLWEVHRELAPGVEPYEEVFVAVRGDSSDALADGFGADFSGSFVVKEVVYAATEGFGCDLDVTKFQFRLAGNEPFWMMMLTDSSARLSRMDAPERTWNDVLSETNPAGTSYSGDDSAVGGEELSGCAIRGEGRF